MNHPNRRKTDIGSIEHDRRRTDPQVFFNRLRTWEAFIVGLLIIIVCCVFAASQARAASWTTIDACYASELNTAVANGSDRFDAQLGHGHAAKCRATAADMLADLRASHLTCSYVGMFHILADGGTSSGNVRVEVTCALYGGGNIWYVSNNGRNFKQER